MLGVTNTHFGFDIFLARLLVREVGHVNSIQFKSIYYPAMKICFVYMQVGIHHLYYT